MVTEAMCRQIASGISESFSCSALGRYVQVRTPFVYPDGTVIDLYMREQGDRWTATDLGETLRWLDGHSWAEKRTAPQQQLIQQICGTLGVEEFQGALLARVESPARTADAVTRLAQAAARVADVWFTFRAKVAATVRDEVEEFLQARKIPHERAVRMVGLSGKQWTLDFHTRTEGQSSLVQVLATESRGASSRLTEHTVAAWVDLKALAHQSGTTFISLFDDTVDVWRDEDFRQLEPLSTVAFWSNPERFAEQLAA